MQLIHAIPLIWKQKINDREKNVETNYVVQDHHLTKNTKAIASEKLTSREIPSVLLLSSGNMPTTQKYFDKVFSNKNFDWIKIYILPKVVTINVIFNIKYFIKYYI